MKVATGEQERPETPVKIRPVSEMTDEELKEEIARLRELREGAGLAKKSVTKKNKEGAATKKKKVLLSKKG